MQVRQPEPRKDSSGHSKQDGGTARAAGAWRRRRQAGSSWAASPSAAARPRAVAAAGSSHPFQQRRLKNFLSVSNCLLGPDWDFRSPGFSSRTPPGKRKDFFQGGGAQRKDNQSVLRIPKALTLYLFLSLSVSTYLLSTASLESRGAPAAAAATGQTQGFVILRQRRRREKACASLEN